MQFFKQDSTSKTKKAGIKVSILSIPGGKPKKLSLRINKEST